MRSPATGARTRQLLVLVGGLLVVALWWWSQHGETSYQPDRTDQPNRSGLATVPLEDLPREARETARLIERGGPFPYERDGVTFRNDEGLLPQQPRGFYREYTVPTPGSDDRGARRIVAGGETMYYTHDHYRSFVVVGEP